VKKEDGSPLPGVEVTCYPQRDPQPRPALRPGEKPPEREPVDLAVEAAVWHRWTQAAKRRATTDAAGEFRIEGIADRKHQVNAYLPGWQIQPKDWRETSQARPGMDLNLVAKASVEVRVEISCPDGPLPENLQIRQEGPQGRGGFGFNAENPVIRIEPGTHELTAIGGDAEEYRSDPQTVVVPDGSVGVTVVFVLRGRPGIRGKVLFPPGEEWDQPQVLLQRLGKDEKASAAGLRASSREATRRYRSVGEGYAFSDLAPGRYGVGVARGHEGPVVVFEEVEVGEGPVTRDLRVPPADPSEFVVVRVLKPDGAAVTDFTATTGFKGKGFSSSGGGISVRRADGSRLVFHHAQTAPDDPDGMFSITVDAKSLGGATVEYRKGERSEWTVRLEEPGRVEARVTGHRGTPYEDRLQFVLAPPGGTARHFGMRHGAPRVDASGLQVIPGIQPGEYSLQLLLEGGQRMANPIARLPVSVRSGRNEFTVPLPELHEVAITGAGPQVHVLRQGEGAERLVIFVQSSGGNARVDGLLEGEYEVQSGEKRQKFRVPGTTKVEL
jgi:hypothetical protein